MTTPLLVVTAGESERSRTNALATAAVTLAGDPTERHRVVTLSTLDPAGLLGRAGDEEVDAALEAAASAPRLLLATPVYRATYAGLLKVFLDRLPTAALARTAVVLVATGGSRDHLLALDTGLRAAVASLSGWTVPTTVYGTPEDFDDARRPLAPIREALATALAEAELVATALAP